MGIGPGALDHLSRRAYNAISEAQVIVGYLPYLRLLKRLISGKDVIASGMTQEVKRVRLSIQKALSGKKVCLVSSGDPGVYGMAGISLELLENEDAKNLKIEIIPGITAATSCAGLLGAPLMNDFAVISLSDILTDLELIKQRVAFAAKGDFVIVFYNPRSKKRFLPLKAAWEILMEHKSPDTPIGIVRNAARSGEEIIITRLKNMLKVENIDMVTTIIVGNSKTYTRDGYMITPRGYNSKL